ncbi:DUF6252 family protein [Pontibacter vulgaris]|uniref:DUF6252 family protein n=1 Tax=Pontibacter vulgaris TaxID=2905679 RepID=UPI001FA75643|nr:DUF6252 family protein [Pontibacter vulgaris]
MKNKLCFLASLILLLSCSKDNICNEAFCVKINGKKWWPSSGFKVNSLSFNLVDNGNRFWFSAQNGSTSILVSVRDTTRGIQLGDYELAEGYNAGYYTKDSNIEFRTNINNTGSLSITAIDKSKRTISGTFYFKARNSTTGEVVEISDGSFNRKTYYEF